MENICIDKQAYTQGEVKVTQKVAFNNSQLPPGIPVCNAVRERERERKREPKPIASQSIASPPPTPQCTSSSRVNKYLVIQRFFNTACAIKDYVKLSPVDI